MSSLTLPPPGIGPLTSAAITQDLGLQVKEKIEIKNEKSLLTVSLFRHIVIELLYVFSKSLGPSWRKTGMVYLSLMLKFLPIDVCFPRIPQYLDFLIVNLNNQNSSHGFWVEIMVASWFLQYVNKMTEWPEL